MLKIDGSTVKRDRWERPIIDGTPYARASTIANALDDQHNLINWAARMAVVGMATSPDLIAAAATTAADDKKALDQIADAARERAKSRAGATIGTAIHTATEMLDLGENISILPIEIRQAAHAYKALIEAAHLTPLAAECFVVNHELQTAGTFDRLLQGPNRVVVGDVKTGGNPDAVKYSALSWAIQIAVYANAQPWHPEHGVVTWADLGLPEPSLTHGLVIHVVQDTADAHLYSIDLEAGYAAAKIARTVYDLRKVKGLATAVSV
jgi:hypothetical protein